MKQAGARLKNPRDRMRPLIRMSGVILTQALLMLLPAGCREGGGGKAGPDEKPNFVWIVSEDNSVHYLKMFDPHGIAAPHIEALAREGITYTRAFSNGPVCSVARSALISSCFGPRTGTQFHRKSELVPMPEGVEMFPAYLRGAGYYTTNNRKEDYNFMKGGKVWDESSGAAHWRHRGEGQPFFHMESHPESHESRLHFPREMVEDYRPVTDPDTVHLFPVHPDTEIFRFTAAFYRDRILAIDTIVGRVVRELEEEGLLESTFIFYFGDHGGVLPGSKGYLYETGLHVPLVVRIPERFRHRVHPERGSRTGDFVSFVDFGPTLLNLAGVELPEGIDGVPFLGGSAGGNNRNGNRVAYGYADRFDEKYDMDRSLRKGRFKYIRHYQPFNPDGLHNYYRYRCLAYQEWRRLFREGGLNAVQRQFFEPRPPEVLYDLESDPYETRNLAEDPGHRELLAEMREELTAWVRGMPDLSFIPEPELRREAFGDPVTYGESHREDISRLLDIADLSLLTFEEAGSGIREALESGDHLAQYWALIVCSSFGSEAAPFYPLAREMRSHPNLLVRTRAAEFLALSGLEDPGAVITGALYETRDGIEATLILNTVVLLMDSPAAYRFMIEEERMAEEVLQEEYVQRRLEYIRERKGET